MKRLITIIGLLISSFELLAQTGIGTTTPHPSAKLHVNASDKGFLPPRVTLVNSTDASTIPSPAEGLLVYHLGSAGLQAGYYYWNGSNWTTIATALLSGDNVQAANLVKLYQEAYSTASNKAPSTGGFSFTVPVSGRYEFNFNCTGWNANGSKVVLTFNIRQGTTVLGSDYHESTSSNVWAEYEGRVEVNLTAGVTYNAQVVTTTGSRDTRDWDKIFYKLVAGNLPINQHNASTNIQLNNNFLSNDGGNEGIRIDNDGNVGIGTSSPTSRLNVVGDVNVAGALNVSGSSNVNLQTPAVLIGASSGDEGGEMRLSLAQTNQSLNNNVIMDVYRNQLRFLEGGGSARGVNIDLSKAPAGASGELIWKASGIVNAGTFVTLDNIRATVPASGNRGLSIAATSTGFSANISAYYAMNGGVAGSATNNTSITTSATGSLFGWNFPTEGDGSYYTIVDKTNNRMYRITLMIGSGYNTNFISIERLF
ncbi:MAG: hypothetical protein RLZZ185_863 [Bacteroidota bacterium]